MQIDTHDDDMMSEINMTPFVDVMLVLLIIFLVTLPLVHPVVNVELPKVSAESQPEPPEPIKISIDRDGQYRIEQELMDIEKFKKKLSQLAQLNPKAVVHFYADINVRYDDITKVLSEIQKSGLSKIGFVTQSRASPNE
jgi:biopolymer transport protein ExbD